MTEPTGTKPALAEVPAGFDQLGEDQQDRFVDLAGSCWAPGRRTVGRTGRRMEAMIMDSEVLSSLYAEVINGVAKSESRFRGLPDFSAAWDRAVEEIERIRREHPDVRIDLPL